ncbi:MAG TPA: hypothetical protein VFB55_00745, partial [Verrucomicrobiae bacterium]|nr:hypothetical protein [Verrucomicrobiae bacterium]
MSTHRNLLAIPALIAGLLLAGCTFNAGYNPSYLPAQPMALGITGKCLVVIADADAQWAFSGSPTSFTGGGTTLTISLGDITKQVALKVFGAAFKEGADFRNTRGDASSYRLIVTPKVTKFSYAYNQLKNLGFAITPQVQLELHASLLTPDGKILLDKTYVSGLAEGDTYVLSGKPAEKVNQIVHQTLF